MIQNLTKEQEAVLQKYIDNYQKKYPKASKREIKRAMMRTFKIKKVTNESINKR